MTVIDSTPEFVSNVYQRMDRTLQALSKHLGRPLGLADKVLLSHLDDPSSTGMVRGKSYIQLRPDRVILQDVLGQTVHSVKVHWLQAATKGQWAPKTRPDDDAVIEFVSKNTGAIGYVSAAATLPPTVKTVAVQ